MYDFAVVAQSVVHRLGKAEVTGSSPVNSSTMVAFVQPFLLLLWLRRTTALVMTSRVTRA